MFIYKYTHSIYIFTTHTHTYKYIHTFLYFPISKYMCICLLPLREPINVSFCFGFYNIYFYLILFPFNFEHVGLLVVCFLLWNAGAALKYE